MLEFSTEGGIKMGALGKGFYRQEQLWKERRALRQGQRDHSAQRKGHRSEMLLHRPAELKGRS